MKAYITKIEYVLPENKVDNPKNRLTKKTGILSRHICAEDETAAEEIAESYRIDSNFEGKFEITEFADTNTRFDCDYVVT